MEGAGAQFGSVYEYFIYPADDNTERVGVDGGGGEAAGVVVRGEQTVYRHRLVRRTADL